MLFIYHFLYYARKKKQKQLSLCSGNAGTINDINAKTSATHYSINRAHGDPGTKKHFNRSRQWHIYQIVRIVSELSPKSNSWTEFTLKVPTNRWRYRCTNQSKFSLLFCSLNETAWCSFGWSWASPPQLFLVQP